VEFDSAFNIRPDLAKSWEIKENGTLYIFHLYENATWHDGTPITAEDVKFCLDIARIEGGVEELLKRLESPEKRIRIKKELISGLPEWRSLAGKYGWGFTVVSCKGEEFKGLKLTDIARRMGKDPFNACIELLKH